MQELNIALACISLLLLLLGLVYKKLQRSPLSEPIIAMAAGSVLGPAVTGLIDVEKWGSSETIVEVTSQLTISIGLMATAFRVPKSYLFNHKRLQALLILLGMAGMCACSTLLVRLFSGLDWLTSFLVGAVITPTDPVVASTIVSGKAAKKLLPDRVRHAISFESGANDGMAYPLVLLPLLLLQKPTGKAVEEWLLKSVLWETAGGIAFGLLIGYLAATALLKAKKAGWTAKPALLVFALALGFFVLGLLELIGCNGIVGVFAAGFTANYVLDKDEDLEQEEIQEALERIFVIPVFLIFGLVLPWAEWQGMGWNAIWLVLAVLLLRRLPALLALKPLLKELPLTADVLFVGWFGPVGVAAMFYAMLCLQKVGLHQVWVIASLVVFGSTIVHGSTGYPFARLYHRSTGRPVRQPT